MIREREVTIYDIARKLNISIATVSRALKDDPVVSKKTKKKIADLAKEMGYRSNHFARNLRSQRTNTIGVIIPMLNSYFQSTVVAGIESVANSEGYNLIISQSNESEEKEINNAKTMFNNRVDGLLVSVAYETESTEHFDQFIKKNIPLIFFDRIIENLNCTNVVIDNRQAGYDATKHLIEQGCKRIMHITATTKRNVYADRLQGYKDALRDHDIEFNKNYVIISNLAAGDGSAVVKKILEMNPRPDAIFVTNDYFAVSCMLELKKAGIRIPEDIAIIGFNNDPMSRVVEPNLTSINNPGYEIGRIAARNLISHLTGKTNIATTNTVILRSELVVRESSKRLAK
jgi:LacI family transcriptional regulator